MNEVLRGARFSRRGAPTGVRLRLQILEKQEEWGYLDEEKEVQDGALGRKDLSSSNEE